MWQVIKDASTDFSVESCAIELIATISLLDCVDFPSKLQRTKQISSQAIKVDFAGDCWKG